MHDERPRHVGPRLVGSAMRWVFPALLLIIGPQSVPAEVDAGAADPDPQRFAKAIEAFERWDAKNTWPADAVLFVGSSSMRMWPTREAFPDLPVINRGFGGAHISDVVHYFDQVVRPYSPRVIVFYCGDNDIAAGKTPQQVYDDYREFVQRVRAVFPATHIVYLPIKPSESRWNHWPRMQEANALIQTIIREDPAQSSVDVATPLLGTDGKPKAEYFLGDKLHLSDAGYRVWNDALRAHLATIIRQPAQPSAAQSELRP